LTWKRPAGNSGASFCLTGTTKERPEGRDSFRGKYRLKPRQEKVQNNTCRTESFRRAQPASRKRSKKKIKKRSLVEVFRKLKISLGSSKPRGKVGKRRAGNNAKRKSLSSTLKTHPPNGLRETEGGRGNQRPRINNLGGQP